jgi:hypothetical protein
MANEIIYKHANATDTLYAVLFLLDQSSDRGKVWDTSAVAWATFSGTDYADYDIALTVSGTTEFYFASLPSALSLDRQYRVIIMQQAGGSPDPDADTMLEQYMLGPSVSPVAADIIPLARTWELPASSSGGYESKNQIKLQPGVTTNCAMDFANVLAADVVLSSFDTCTDAASQSPAISLSNLRVRGGTKAVVEITTITDAKNYRIKCTVTTSDGDTLIGIGRLSGEDNP